MRFHRSNSTEQNFWVSYADLMAGLLFVFILVLGAIVVKYVFIQNDLSGIKTDLIQQQQLLTLKEEELLQKNQNILRMSDELDALKKEKSILNIALETSQFALMQREEEANQTKGELLLAHTLLEETNQTLEIKNAQILQLTQTLLEQQSIHNTLLEDLNLAKTRIKSLTGIRFKVVQELKNKMGRSIHIDPNSGAIRLPSSVLFDVGSFEIKPEAKVKLKETLEPYFEVLLGDDEIRQNIDKIIIEGHTDSDGTYMNNLELSQKRALSVMAFIYTWDEKRHPVLQNYLSAQGRSYSDRIIKNGLEDKEASRRIEIKFSLSNKKAIEEIENFLKR